MAVSRALLSRERDGNDSQAFREILIYINQSTSLNLKGNFIT